MLKLWAVNLLSRQLPPVSCFAFVVGECRYADLPIAPSDGLLSLLYDIRCVFCSLAVQNTLQRRSLNDFFLEEQLCQLF